MNSEWKKYSLGDISICFDKKRIPLSSQEREKRKGIYPYYGAQGIIDYIDDFIFDGEYLLVAEDGNNVKTRTQDIARIAKGKYWVNNHAHILTANHLSDLYFLHYYINSMDISGYVTGSAQPKLNQNNLNSLAVNLPPLPEQKKIAEILSSLDDKIELNNKMNKNLEEIAQTIFKQWFVDFEFPDENGHPYKSSGGKVIESELGEIPEGWSVKELGKVTEFGKLIMGLSPKSSTYNTQGIGTPLLNGAADFSNGLITPKKYTTDPQRIAKKGDLVFCIRATIGLLTFSDGEYCLGRGVVTLSGINKLYIEYIYETLERSFESLVSLASGSVIKGLTKPDINKMKVVLPVESIIKLFNKNVNDLYTMKLENEKLTQSLTQTRDELLPKLMSGEIRV